MLTWIDQSIVKIVELEYELKNLRQGHIIADKRHKGSLASLKSLAAKAAEAAERSARAGSRSVVAAKHAILVAQKVTNDEQSLNPENAVVEAAAREAAASVAAVLEAAALAMAQQADMETILAAMAASMAAIRSAEAAAEVSGLAQKATLMAKTAMADVPGYD